jgi:DNA-binding MurR/RpiR family transcriptional regulator
MSETIFAPKDFAALKTLLIQKGSELPKRLTQVASYALDHPDEIAFGTVASIAQQADVQPSTLVRFSQALGYQGFSELQEVFRDRLRDRVLNYEERIAQLREHAANASKANVLLQGFIDAAGKSLNAMQARIDAGTLDRAVTLLAKAETLYLIGFRRSYPVATYMAYAFSKLGVRHMLIDGHAGLGADELSFATNNDALIAISFTPYANETINLVSLAKDRDVPVVALTDSVFSPLAKQADIFFEIAEANFEGFRSLAATLALAMTLTVAIAERR